MKCPVSSRAGGGIGPERIELSAKERDRLKVLHEVEQCYLKQLEAARHLRVSDRQILRLQVRLRAEINGVEVNPEGISDQGLQFSETITNGIPHWTTSGLVGILLRSSKRVSTFPVSNTASSAGSILDAASPTILRRRSPSWASGGTR
jgi:hypothetical protein